MATATVHQWRDLERGLAEMRRVARGPVAVLTFAGDALERWWVGHYFPGVVALERRRCPAIGRILAGLGAAGVVHEIPMTGDCAAGRAPRSAPPDRRRIEEAWASDPRGYPPGLVTSAPARCS